METQLSREKLEALVEIQTKIDELEFEEILPFLVARVIAVLKVERCCIFRIFADAEIALLLAGEPKGEHGIGDKFSFSELEQVKDAVETKEIVLIPDVWNDKRTKKTLELFYFKDVRSVVLVPIVVRDEVVALLAVDDSHQKRGFSEEEVYFLRLLANQVGHLLERDRLQKEKDERETFCILGQAAAEAAHRFKNPLMIIGGYARRMSKVNNSPWFRNPFPAAVNFIRRLMGLNDSLRNDYAERIAEQVEKLEKMVNALLNFSGPKRQKLLEIDINEVLKEIEKSVITDGKKIEFDLHLSAEAPTIIGDPEEIKGIFSLILQNAVEAIKENGKVVVRSRQEKEQINICITNNGGCVDDEIVNEIFNPFFTTKQESTGLGLSIANATIRAYGGEIRVENDKLSNLTTFIVKLPIRA